MRKRYADFETTIKGGLPIVIKAILHPPEPDVGLMEWYPEYEVFWTNGKRCSIEIPYDDHERIMDQCLELAE